jgi:hypothetical protein
MTRKTWHSPQDCNQTIHTTLQFDSLVQSILYQAREETSPTPELMPSTPKSYRRPRRAPAHLRTKTGCMTCMDSFQYLSIADATSFMANDRSG